MTTGTRAIVTPATLPEAWQGIAEWTPADDGLWQPWRIPRHELATCHAPELTEKAKVPSGARVQLRTDATTLELTTTGDPDRMGVIDILVDDTLVSSQRVPRARRTTEIALPAGPKRLELWLPHNTRTRIGPLHLDASFVEPPAPPRVRWVAYASSITQCGEAPTPTRTWPALVSRNLDWHLTSLGLAGQAHLDHPVASTIAALPADVISLCLGINVHNKATFTARSFPAAVTGFIRTVRIGHPTTPIAVMTPIASPTREHTRNASGLTLAEIRAIVTEATDTLAAQGDDNLHLVDGRQILSDDEAHLLVDGLHPGPAGYEHMADTLTPALSRVLG